MRDSALVRLYVATFLYSFAHALGVPLVPEHLQLTFAAPLQFIGAVMGLYGLMQIVLRLPMGDMADRRGRKPSLLLAFASTALSGLLFAFGPNAWWSVPASLLFGFSGGVFWVAANSYLFDRADDIPRATSDYTIAMSLAFLVGPPIGHLVADVWGFQAAFLIYVAASLAGLALTFTLPEVKPAPRPPPTTSSYRRALVLLRHPALVLSAMGAFTYSLLFSTQQTFFQLHVLAVGLSITVAGVLLGGRQATSLAIRLALPALLRRAGAANVLAGGILVLAVSTLFVPLATTLPLLVVLVGVAGLATGAMIPANLMLVHEGAPREERGLANGIYGTMLGFGSALAPVVFGTAGARYGLDAAFWSAGLVALALLAGLVAYRVRRAPASGASPAPSRADP